MQVHLLMIMTEEAIHTSKFLDDRGSDNQGSAASVLSLYAVCCSPTNNAVISMQPHPPLMDWCSHWGRCCRLTGVHHIEHSSSRTLSAKYNYKYMVNNYKCNKYTTDLLNIEVLHIHMKQTLLQVVDLTSWDVEICTATITLQDSLTQRQYWPTKSLATTVLRFNNLTTKTHPKNNNCDYLCENLLC